MFVWLFSGLMANVFGGRVADDEDHNMYAAAVDGRRGRRRDPRAYAAITGGSHGAARRPSPVDDDDSAMVQDT